jgi:hypothetical protein
MNMFAKKLGITLLTAATVFAPLSTSIAQAGEAEFQAQQDYYDRFGKYELQRQNRHVRNHRTYSGRHDNDGLVLGIIGLGAAAIIGGAIANSNNPRVIYRQPAAPRAVSGGSYEPWSRSWYRYCSNKYRSFNASTGTYRGYDGRDHFCVVN